MAAQSLLVIGFVMVSLLFLVYGRPQDLGRRDDAARPERGCVFGLLQTVADALK